MALRVGVGRTTITPYWGVELTGWGYYLERRWRQVHDDLCATALVLDDGRHSLALISLDLMVISADFTRRVREMVGVETAMPEDSVLVACTHTHNAPASGGLLGVGEVDVFYEQWAARQAATAAIKAWRNRSPAKLSVSSSELRGVTFNRTRDQGPVDPTLTVLHVDHNDGRPLAKVVGYQAHPTVQTVLRPFDVGRDVPGDVCDLLEQRYPGALAMYIQGACGDANFLREYSTEDRAREPARAIADAIAEARAETVELDEPILSSTSLLARIPTRRWTIEEIEHDRREAQRRLSERDTRGWRETIGRAMTNRPDDMVRRHGGDEWKAVAAMCRFQQEWTERMLADPQRPEWLDTEVQAIRIGNLGIVSNSSEMFSNFALEVRERCPVDHLMVCCYANGRIGYLPDEHDVLAKSYAAYQSPKYCNQHPFTAQSGPAMRRAMLQALQQAMERT